MVLRSGENYGGKAEMVKGRVLRAYGSLYRVQVLGQGEEIEAYPHPKLFRETPFSAPVVVGDWVRLEQEPDTGEYFIVEIYPRRNAFTRNRKGKGPQIVAANLDQAVIVFSTAKPQPVFQLLDKFLVASATNDLEPLIVANKWDLVTPEVAGHFQRYEDIGFRLLRTSALTGFGLEVLKEALKEKVSVLVGPSGVGKSSLLNQLQPGLGLKVGDVSKKTGKGRHITTSAALIPLESGGWVADTPGLRELEVAEVDEEAVYQAFPEVVPYLGECEFSDCRHYAEPGCAVREAMEAGKIHPWRYTSFLHFLKVAEETAEAWRKK